MALFSALAFLAGCGSALPLQGSATGPLSTRSLAETPDIPPGYYDAASGLHGPSLIKALHRIVARHTDLGYAHGRDVMFGPVSDPDDEDIVADLYTGQERKGVHDRSTAYSKGLNAEHTWPQSLGAVGPAQADLHHLQPADIKINSSRSSYPYGEVTGKELLSWAGIDGESKLGTASGGYTCFEPRSSVRGNVARGLLYFYTVYSVDSDGTGPRPRLDNFRRELPVLLIWSQQDLPDAGEKARNEAVYQAQGNRNPYVDHPEWASEVSLP